MCTILISLFMLIHISVKALIWSKSLMVAHEINSYAIYICRGEFAQPRYTSEQRRKLFKKANSLLAPAMIIFFLTIAVKLIKKPDIFEEEK